MKGFSQNSLRELPYVLALIMALVAIIFLQPGYSEDRRREEFKHQEKLNALKLKLQDAQKVLDDIRINRWQDKRNEIIEVKAFKELWEQEQNQLDKLERILGQKNESLLRLTAREREQRDINKDLLQRQKEFGLQVLELSDNFTRNRQFGFPDGRKEIISALEEASKQIESQNYYAGRQVLSGVFSSLFEDLRTHNETHVKRSSFAFVSNPASDTSSLAIHDPKLESGFEIKLGNVYKAFVSTESPRSALLVKSGTLDEKAWVWLERLTPETREHLAALSSVLSADVDSSLVHLPMDVQLKKATGTGFASGHQLTALVKLKNELIGVGFVLWILIPIIVFGFVAVLVKCVVYINKGILRRGFGEKVTKLVEEGKVFEAQQLCKKAKGSLPRVMRAILSKRNRPRGYVEDVVYEIMLHESQSIEKNIGTINILAAAAPLIGLLGTVSGMVNLFSAITLHGTGDPKVMASGIAEALLSTKWGLLAAIPLLLIYNWLSNVSQKMVSDMEKYSTRLINLIYVPAESDPKEELASLHSDELHDLNADSKMVEKKVKAKENA